MAVETYAVIDATHHIVNLVLWDAEAAPGWEPSVTDGAVAPLNVELVQPTWQIGGTWDGTTYTPPSE